MYEMLVGYPPFCSEDPRITCRKVLPAVTSVSLGAKEILIWHSLPVTPVELSIQFLFMQITWL